MDQRLKNGLTMVIAAAFALGGLKFLGGMAGLGMVMAGDAYFETLAKLPGTVESPALIAMQKAFAEIYRDWSMYSSFMGLIMLPLSALLVLSGVFLVLKKPQGRHLALAAFALAFVLDAGGVVPSYLIQSEMEVVRDKHIQMHLEAMPPGPADEFTKKLMKSMGGGSGIMSLAFQSVVLFVYAGAFFFLRRREVKIAIDEQVAAKAAAS